jgi:hypothetical protein
MIKLNLEWSENSIYIISGGILDKSLCKCQSLLHVAYVVYCKWILIRIISFQNYKLK